MDYTIKQNKETGLYSVIIDDIEIAEGLEIGEAVLMVETIINREEIEK